MNLETHNFPRTIMINPPSKTFMVYCLNEVRQYAKAEIYADQDIFESTVIEGLKIALLELFGVPAEPASSKP
jgi:hypothetical protein